MWKAAVQSVNKRPEIWLRHNDTKEFIHKLAQVLKVTPDHFDQLVKAQRGGIDHTR
jgi:hypothetical protein